MSGTYSRPFDLNNNFPKKVILTTPTKLLPISKPPSLLYNNPTLLKFDLIEPIQSESRQKDLTWAIKGFGITPRAINNPPSGSDEKAAGRLILKLGINHTKLQRMFLFGYTDDRGNESTMDDIGESTSISSAMKDQMDFYDLANATRIICCYQFQKADSSSYLTSTNLPPMLSPLATDRVSADQKITNFFKSGRLYVTMAGATQPSPIISTDEHRLVDLEMLSEQKKLAFLVFRDTILAPKAIGEPLSGVKEGTILKCWQDILDTLSTAICDVLKNYPCITKSSYFVNRTDVLQELFSGMMGELFSSETNATQDDFSSGTDIFMLENGSMNLNSLLNSSPKFRHTMQSMKEILKRFTDSYVNVMMYDRTVLKEATESTLFVPFITLGPLQIEVANVPTLNASTGASITATRYTKPNGIARLKGVVPRSSNATQSISNLFSFPTLGRKLNYPWSLSNDAYMDRIIYRDTCDQFFQTVYTALWAITDVSYLVLSLNSAFEQVTDSTSTNYDYPSTDLWTSKMDTMQSVLLQQGVHETSHNIRTFIRSYDYGRNMILPLFYRGMQNHSLGVDENWVFTNTVMEEQKPHFFPIPFAWLEPTLPDTNPKTWHKPLFPSPYRTYDLALYFLSHTSEYYPQVNDSFYCGEDGAFIQDPSTGAYSLDTAARPKITQDIYIRSYGGDPAQPTTAVNRYQDAQILEVQAAGIDAKPCHRYTISEYTYRSSEDPKRYDYDPQSGTHYRFNFLLQSLFNITSTYTERAISLKQIWKSQSYIRMLEFIQTNPPNWTQNALYYVPQIPSDSPLFQAEGVFTQGFSASSLLDTPYECFKRQDKKILVGTLPNEILGLQWIDIVFRSLSSTTVICSSDGYNQSSLATRLFLKPESRMFFDHNHFDMHMKCFKSAHQLHTLNSFSVEISDPTKRHFLDNCSLHIELEINQQDEDENDADPAVIAPWAPSDPSELEKILEGKKRRRKS